MLPGMSATESARLFERISATAIANQAILKCSLAGAPLTVDNVILFVGDFVQPDEPAVMGLMDRITNAIQEVIDCKALVKHIAAANDAD